MRLQRLLVGVDGSSHSRAALAWAAGLARTTGAEVVAVHAVGLLEDMGGDAPVPTVSHLEEIRERFEGEWCRPLDDEGVRSRRLLRDGPPVLALLAALEEEDADLVVVGPRGHGGFADALGSTSARLALQSPRPVVIVPSEADDRP